MFGTMKVIALVLVGFSFSFSAGAENFRNSCMYSFEKAVYNITPNCSFNMFQGETILQYGDAPIDDIERCTANSAMRPMTADEANELLAKLHAKIFSASGEAEIESELSFDVEGKNLQGMLVMNIRGFEDRSSFSVPATQISDGVLRIGDLKANMKSPYVASFWAEDALEVHLAGTCTGPYFQKSL